MKSGAWRNSILVLGLAVGLAAAFACGTKKNESGGAATLRVVPDAADAIYSVGATVTVSLEVDRVTDLYSLALDLSYNKDVLEFWKAEEGTFLSGSGTTLFNSRLLDDVQGRVIIGLTRKGAGGTPASGQGVILTLSFAAKAVGQSAMTIENLKVKNSAGTNVFVSKAGETISVR